MTRFIGVAGGSGSGKTSLLKRILGAVDDTRVSVLSHDAYYRDLSERTLEERASFNFDHPDALETDLLCEHIDRLQAGEVVHQPVYDFERHTRSDRTTPVAPAPVVIVEGILVLADQRLRSRFHLGVYVHAADDVRLLRRLQRDTVKRGRSVDSVIQQYQETVKPMHHAFVEPSRKYADLIVPGGGHNLAAVQVLTDHIDAMLARSIGKSPTA